MNLKIAKLSNLPLKIFEQIIELILVYKESENPQNIAHTKQRVKILKKYDKKLKIIAKVDIQFVITIIFLKSIISNSFPPTNPAIA